MSAGRELCSRVPSAHLIPFLKLLPQTNFLTCLWFPPSEVVQNRNSLFPLFSGFLPSFSTTRLALLTALKPPLPPSEEETPLWHLGWDRVKGLIYVFRTSNCKPGPTDTPDLESGRWQVRFYNYTVKCLETTNEHLESQITVLTGKEGAYSKQQPLVRQSKQLRLWPIQPRCVLGKRGVA